MKYCNKERLVSSISKNCTPEQCASQLKHVHLIGVAFNLLASQSVAGYRGGDILYVDTNHIQLINNKYNVLIVLIIDNCTIGSAHSPCNEISLV